MTVLTANQVNELCVFIENRLEKNGCDHSLKNTFEWAEKNGMNWRKKYEKKIDSYPKSL